MFSETVFLFLAVAWLISNIGFIIYLELRLRQLRKKREKIEKDLEYAKEELAKEKRSAFSYDQPVGHEEPDLFDQMTEQHKNIDQDRQHVKNQSTPPVLHLCDQMAEQHKRLNENSHSVSPVSHRSSSDVQCDVNCDNLYSHRRRHDYSDYDSSLFLGGAILGGIAGHALSEADDDKETNDNCDCDCDCDCDCSSDCNCDCSSDCDCNCDCSDW